MAIFTETDVLNKIRTKNSKRKYTEYEIVSPFICNQLFMTDSWKQWKFGFRYTSIKCPTPWGYGLVYILCINPEMSFLRSFDTDELSSWRNIWKDEPIIVCSPIINYNTDTPWFLSIYSKKCKMETHTSNQHVMNIDTLLHKNAFAIANGETLFIGLHRFGKISASKMLTIWKADTSVSREIHIDHSPYLQQVILQYPINTYIANHPEIYMGYGNTNVEVIKYMLSCLHDDDFEPVIERIHTDRGTLRITYISLHTIYVHHMSKPIVWKTLQPHLTKMSIEYLREWDINDDIMQTHKIYPNHRAIINGFAKIQNDLDDPGLLLEYFLWIKKEYNYNMHNMAKMLLLYSSILYNTVHYRGVKKDIHNLWKNILLLCFHRDNTSFIQWFGKHILECYNNLYDCPPLEYFKVVLELDVDIFKPHHFLIEDNTCISITHRWYSFYDILSLFKNQPDQVPYIVKTRIIQPIIHKRLQLIYQICKDYPPGCIDPLNQFLRDNRNYLLT